jgi:hypothetical protein
MKGGATAAPSPKEMKKETEKQVRLLPDIIKGSDLALGVGFVLVVHTAADIIKAPYRFLIFYPVLLGTSKSDPFFNRLMFGFGRYMTNIIIKGFINKLRAESGLQPIKDVWRHWMGEHVIAACDKELNAVPEKFRKVFNEVSQLTGQRRDRTGSISLHGRPVSEPKANRQIGHRTSCLRF